MGDSTPIQTSLTMLREAIIGGVEAVKATICSWTSERRWCAVLLLEEVAFCELRLFGANDTRLLCVAELNH
ncbi:MAG: hypothetical protein AAF630_00850 [Cyanobacteria bacterium P01_C01_bin.38]